nr:CPPV020 C-type lectin family protein [Cooks petrelpox virus]
MCILLKKISKIWLCDNSTRNTMFNTICDANSYNLQMVLHVSIL